MDLNGIGDDFFGAPRSLEQWDAIRNWVTLVVGATAAIVALSTFIANSRTRRRAQARLVYAKSVGSSMVREESTFFIGVTQVGAIEDGMMASSGEREDVRPGGAIGQYRAVDRTGSVTHVEVHNRSDELIGPVRVRIKREGVSARSNKTVAVIPILEPNSETRVYVGWTHGEKRPDHEPVIDFRDASGQWWQRDAASPIRKSRWFNDLGRRV